jgi:hypothetical protein
VNMNMHMIFATASPEASDRYFAISDVPHRVWLRVIAADGKPLVGEAHLLDMEGDLEWRRVIAMTSTADTGPGGRPGETERLFAILLEFSLALLLGRAAVTSSTPDAQ